VAVGKHEGAPGVADLTDRYAEAFAAYLAVRG
jgi:hypothetical protein